MCIFAAGRVVQITIWHLLGVIQLARKHEYRCVVCAVPFFHSVHGSWMEKAS